MTPSSEQPQLKAAAVAANRPQWQFGLQHLFGLTTLVAFAAALTAAFGPQLVVPSAGVLLAWLNLCGAFRIFQEGTAQKRLLWLAWATFLISLALPSVLVLTSSRVYGWQAVVAAIQIPYYAVVQTSWGDVSLFGGLVCLIIDCANLLAVLMPLLIWRLGRGKGKRMSEAICLSAVGTWVMWDSQMLVGYYVWCSSFLLAQVALTVNRTLFGGITALTIVLGAMTTNDPW
jgi:hypothetical protein